MRTGVTNSSVSARAYACCNAALLIYAHRGNIRRMLNGTESRVTTPVFGRRFDGK